MGCPREGFCTHRAKLEKGSKKQMPLMNDFCDLFFMVLYFGIIKMKKIETLKF
jgi:hypothetical protein